MESKTDDCPSKGPMGYIVRGGRGGVDGSVGNGCPEGKCCSGREKIWRRDNVNERVGRRRDGVGWEERGVVERGEGSEKENKVEDDDEESFGEQKR